MQLVQCAASLQQADAALQAASQALTAFETSLTSGTGTGAGTGAGKGAGTGAGTGKGTGAGTGSGAGIGAGKGTGTSKGTGAGKSAGTGSGTASRGTGSGAKSGSGGSTSTVASPSQLATDAAAVTQDQVNVTLAQNNLDAATLTAPVTGTIGAIGLTAGVNASASSGITIVAAGRCSGDGAGTSGVHAVGGGGAEGLGATPGGTAGLQGTVTNIGILPSSTSSTSTYPVTITVPNAPVSLLTGSTVAASVSIKQVSDVLTVPVSALTPTGTNAGVVQVVSNGKLTATQVTTGAVGGGRVQVSSGLKEGQQVMLADPSQPLPSLTTGIGGGGAGGAAGAATVRRGTTS